MLAEFLARIVDLASEAKAVQTGALKELPDKVFVRHGEKLEWHDTPAPRRAHTIHAFGDLVELVKDKQIAKDPEVYHSGERVVALLDRSKRREVVTMPLVRTARFVALSKLAAVDSYFTVQEAVRFIRFEMHGVGADALLASIRKVDFTRKGTGQASIEHGRESLGKSVEAAVQGVSQVPEEFVAEVPIWSNSGLKGIKARVRIGVYLDVNAEKIQLRPLSDELTASLETAQGEVHSMLASALDPVPVFQGEVGPIG